MICSSGADKRLLLWDISKGTLKSHLNASIMSSEGEIVPPRRHPVPKVECVAFGHHDTLLAGSDDLWVDSPSRYCLGVLQQWDLETAVLARELSLHTQVGLGPYPFQRDFQFVHDTLQPILVKAMI